MEVKKFCERKSDLLTLISIGIALRAIVSLYPYSGKNKPPLYGDFEAQRHWQEITVNLEPKHWYINSSVNDLLYWGLDYPPLTAYHSYLVGQLAKRIDEEFVELHESRGLESKKHQAFMRLTVLAGDVIIFLPAILMIGLALEKTFNKQVLLVYIAFMWLYPGQILIDNGHFQYNNISLGFAGLAIAGLLTNHDYIAAFLFSLALNYKQMELYHALPFFFYLLRQCIFGPKNLLLKLRKFFTIASIVLITIFILWYPWLKNLESVMAVVNRLFPINRGVFEDKVANFWCVLNIVYKLKTNFSNERMALICLFTTAAVVLPTNVALFLSHRKEKLLYALLNTAMSFFLFSFQVHEKSILLVTLPCSCLIVLNPALASHLLQSAFLSMFPLFIKDELIVPFYTLSTIYFITIKLCQKEFFENEFSNIFFNVTTFINFIITLLVWTAPVPIQYPFLWSLLVAAYSFVNFSICLLLGLYYQLND